ncbi:class II fructose-bisphosphatase [Acetobacter sp.]|uniref:class II fructose-bisphosphatase n=1 Tax=Acetobacter sp. TaxID=440 RepID=UPI0039EA1456
MSDSIGPSPFVVSDRNLALELVRVTEAAALASARWTGRGRKNDADGAAVEAMRIAFDTVAIDGTVVIGEGEMDEAPMLYIGEKVGSGGPAMDIAVDPLEGTNLCAKDMPNAITVVALAERGNFLHAPDVYMDKIVVGPNLPAGVVDLENTIETNLKNLAKARGKSVQDLLLCTLDRERHEEMIARARAAGARVRLLSDGDVAGGIAACLDSSQVDIYVGSGGAPEGVLTAAAVRCVEGQMQGRLLFEDDAQRERAQKMNPGKNPDRKLDLHDMAAGSVLFSATGVTTGALLRGVRQYPHQAVTHSLVMRSKSGTSRFMSRPHT